MRALIFPCLTMITSCFAASAARSGVTLLIPVRALSTTTRFSSRSSSFCNFNQIIHQKQSQKVRNPKFFIGGMPQDPFSRRATCALITYWSTPSQNSRSTTARPFETSVSVVKKHFCHQKHRGCTGCAVVQQAMI